MKEVIKMHNHLPHFHLSGSAYHMHRPHFAHINSLIHHQPTLADPRFIPHPLHWVHSAQHYLQGLHPLRHAYAVVHRYYASHAGHWLADYAVVIAIVSASLLTYGLYVLLSGIRVNDYTQGVWHLFG